MTSGEYINQRVSSGHKIHFHDKVWWEEVHPFFCKPVNFLQKITPGIARPKVSKSFLGYSHIVNDDENANSSRSVMVMNHETLHDFALDNLPKNKRNKVRKGLKLIEVKRIENIADVIEDIKDICISMAKRTRHRLPPEYYIEKYHTWRSYMEYEFSFPNREWWGAYFKDKLIAYRYAVLIDDTMCFIATKSHTEYLEQCPNDALMYNFIEYCKTLSDCMQLNGGDWNNKPSIDNFKEIYGFQKVVLPVYAKYNPLVSMIKKVRKIMQQRTF